MGDHYDKLTESEQAYWDIYTRLRSLSDWQEFSEGQSNRKDDARTWLVEQRKFIWRCAEGKEAPKYQAGWDTNNRRERYEQLKDESLNTGSCRRLCKLPTNSGTQLEKVMISEREMWWRVVSVDDQTKKWRLSNGTWLSNRRKKLYRLAQDDSWSKNNRRTRYKNLCIATKHGKSYDAWAKGHNDSTGEPTGGKSARADAVKLARSFLGTVESPSGSNKGTPQPSQWQRRVYGSSGVPWCACFTTCMAWDAGVSGSGSAAVSIIIDLATSHQGMFRGWTKDPSKVLRGDMAVVGCSTCHIGMVASNSDPYHLIEGNTSPSTSGSQYNGGCVAEKRRPKNQIIGWALVDYP